MTSLFRKPTALLQAMLITAVAAIIVVSVYFFRKTDKLSFIDFNPPGSNNVEFCDPTRPRVISLENKVQRVILSDLQVKSNYHSNVVNVEFHLLSSTRKPITNTDLSTKTIANFQLIAASSSLDDIQLLEPHYNSKDGLWSFEFTPKAAGNYSLFADLIPEATQVEIYTSAHIILPEVNHALSRSTETQETIKADLIKPSPKLYAGQVYELSIQLTNKNNNPILIIPQLGSFARLIVIDASQTAFINTKVDPQHINHTIDLHAPTLFFNLLVPDPGTYVICAAVNISGKLNYFKFQLTVEP
jgi:hypothetical protein